MAFKDYFSDHATGYADHRPHYPAAMFAWLAQQCQHHDLAWDCASGNGQAALALAPHFERIIATDASQAQLIEATPHNKSHYVCASAEQVPLTDQSLNLITVAQATHWIDLPRFYREVERLLIPNGVMACIISRRRSIP